MCINLQCSNFEFTIGQYPDYHVLLLLYIVVVVLRNSVSVLVRANSQLKMPGKPKASNKRPRADEDSDEGKTSDEKKVRRGVTSELTNFMKEEQFQAEMKDSK